MTHKNLKTAAACAFSAFMMFGVVGCTEKEKAKTLYDVLMEIATNEYTKAKGSNVKVEGISSCAFHVDSIEYYAYTKDTVISTSIAYEIKNEEEDLENFVLDYKDQKEFDKEVKFGKRVVDNTIQNIFYDSVLLSRNPDVDPMYGAKDPMKYVSFILDDDPNHISISYTCKNGTGDYISIQDVTYDVNDKEECCHGTSDIFRKKDRPVLYNLMANYIVK